MTPEGKQTSTRPQAGVCIAALDAFAAGNFLQWQGLPAGCELALIEDRDASGSTAEGTALLGKGRAAFRMIDLGRHPEPVRVWHAEGIILLMDTRHPAVSAPLKAVVSHLGAPDMKLEAVFSDIVIPASEWVYVSRGLTLFINPENFRLLRVAVYPATAPEDYRQNLRLQLEVHKRGGFL